MKKIIQQTMKQIHKQILLTHLIHKKQIILQHLETTLQNQIQQLIQQQ